MADEAANDPERNKKHPRPDTPRNVALATSCFGDSADGVARSGCCLRSAIERVLAQLHGPLGAKASSAGGRSGGTCSRPAGQLRIVLELTIVKGRIIAIEAIADPEHLLQLDIAVLHKP